MDYKSSGVDIEAGYKSVELMKKHVARTRNEGSVDDVGCFGGCFRSHRHVPGVAVVSS